MLTHDEALVHARQHLYGLRPPVEWVWVLHAGVRVKSGWFFYYGLEPLRYIRDQEGPQFGGAPGFLVDDGGKVDVIGWSSPILSEVGEKKPIQTITANDLHTD